MNEEIMRILKMVEDGKISSETAKDLIDALNTTTENTLITTYEDKFLRVNVDSTDGDKVNIQLPVKVLKEILKGTGKLPIKDAALEGVNVEDLMNTIIACLDCEAMGEIVNVKSANGDTVRIYIG
ncbi:MAG: SHOCT-like domain-containing protein [Clostridium sp.]